MSSEIETPLKAANDEQRINLLEEEITTLKHQLDWFKRQLFGEKSEKRLLIDNPYQRSFADECVEDPAEPEEKQTISYQRGKAKKDRGNAVNDSGLRFDESVPVEHIRIEPAELQGPDADQYDVIGKNSIGSIGRDTDELMT